MGECWDSHGAQWPQGFAPSVKQGVKSGDWICPSCGDHQYARNDECRKCGEPKPDEGIVQKNSSAPLLPGDWICSECGDHQFGRNDECRKCGASKPENAAIVQAEFKDGDWMCP